jgi:hypothetical protein
MNESDWIEFRRLFPSAASWMDGRGLLRELERLRKMAVQNTITPWQVNRLAELEAWKEAVSGQAGAFTQGG